MEPETRYTAGAVLANELWGIRQGECIVLYTEQPTTGQWIAVKIAPTPLPLGPVAPYVGADGKIVEVAEPCALVAAELDAEGRWQWVWLTPTTKAFLGDWLADEGHVERGCWYFVQVLRKGDEGWRPFKKPSE